MRRAQTAFHLLTAVILCFALTTQAGEKKAGETSFAVVTDGTTSKTSAGEDGTFALRIIPKNGIIKKGPPVDIQLSGAGVKFAKEMLTFDDAKIEDGGAVSFETKFHVNTAGAHELKATGTFFICNDEGCFRHSLDVSVKVKAE